MIDRSHHAIASQSLVYAYGCGAPRAGSEDLEREHARCVALWDQLVTIDAMIEAKVLARAAADVPPIAAANARIDALTALLAADPDAKEARAERRALYGERKALLSNWRRGQREWLRTLERERIAAVVAARQATEAWWPNYNRVLRSYDTARQLVRKFGRRLRPHDPLRDDGVLAFQVQRTRSGLGAAPAELFDGTVSALQFSREPLPGRRASLLEMRVDAAGHTVRLPVWLHRPLPDAARIKAAELIWRREANRTVWRVCLTLSAPLPAPQIVSMDALTAPVRVALGWTLTDAGELRVASAGKHEWSLSAEWMRRYDLVATREGWLRDEIKNIRELYELNSRWATLLENPSHPELFAALQARWGELPGDVREWYRVARNHWRSTAGLRRHVLGERHNHYHHIAREIVRLGPVIELPEIELAQIARELRGDDVNSLRHRAAIHTLEAMIRHQARKIGCRVLASADAIAATPTEKSSSWARRKAAKTAALANADNSVA